MIKRNAKKVNSDNNLNMKGVSTIIGLYGF
jgi:hypothetical protein